MIIAGGRGERFWPMSRARRPKHLLPIVGEEPMLKKTLDRLCGVVEADQVFIITNREQRDAVLEVCPEVPREQVIGEPVGRNTAAAVGLATVLIRRRNPAAAYAVLPSDHMIYDASAFRSDLELAFEVAEQREALVTIGINPTYAATGYGYIEAGDPVAEFAEAGIFKVDRFVEKPIKSVAEKYLASGNYFWNAGMFIWRASVIGGELARFVPTLWQGFEAIAADFDARGEGAMDAILDEHYADMEGVSIDYAVMERTSSIYTVKARFDWDDVGEWLAVERHYDPDERGNVVRGLSVLEGSSRNIIVSEEGHLTALVGVDDLIVVQTADATLICPKNRAQEIRRVVDRIKERSDGEAFL